MVRENEMATGDGDNPRSPRDLNISILSNDRVFIAGKTGSGKSYLTKTLMGGINRLVFIDPKCEHSFPNAQVFDSFPSAKQFLTNKFEEKFFVHVKPNKINHELLNNFLREIFVIGNCTAIFDEVGRFCFPRVCEEHDRLIRQGRSRGIGVWHLTQRPAWIDKYLVSESEHVFNFFLKVHSDRDIMIKNTSLPKEAFEKMKTKKYHFWYDCNDVEQAIFCSPI